jgi:amino acid transporter
MHWTIWAIIIIVLIGIGFSAGFYTSNFFQKQIEVLIGAAVVLAVLTWVGSATDLLGLLRDWERDKREEERIPIL